MSKWTIYQLIIAVIFVALIALNNVYAEQVSTIFSMVEQWIAPSILIMFFTVICMSWGIAGMLLLQEKKGKSLFVHKIWRIMPAIMGVVLFLSFILAVVLFITLLSDMDPALYWIVDLSIIYFLVIYYYFILSIVVRYSKIKTVQGKILTSTNAAVLILFIVILFLPNFGEMASIK